MNKTGRKQIEEVTDKLDTCLAILQELMDEEQEKLDNIPEQLQDGAPAQAIQEVMESLQEAYDCVDNGKSILESI